MASSRMSEQSDGAHPVVTVVIPMHDGERFIGAAIESVLDQSFTRFEVIVVDDGSSDHGPMIVRQYARDPRLFLLHQKRAGAASARNAGAARAHPSSEYVIFLDADDVWHPDTLSQLVEVLEDRPDAAGAFALAEYVDELGRALPDPGFTERMATRMDLRDGLLVPRDPSADVRAEHLFLANHVYPPSCLMMRLEAWRVAGGFDPAFLAEDWEFVVRLAATAPLVPVNEVMVGYRRHSSNASSNRSRNVRGARQVWSAVYSRSDEPARRHLRKIWLAHQRRTVRRKIAAGASLVARARPIAGLTMILDGLAHAMLRRPLSWWAPPLNPRSAQVQRGHRPADGVSTS